MIPIADIDEVWPAIEEKALAVMASDEYGPEDLKSDCREGRALCFATAEGVMVVTLGPNRARKDLEMCVWLAVALDGEGLTAKYMPEIESLAHQLGASRVVFHTRRPGWSRHLDSRWRLRSITYEMELANG